MSLTDIDKGSDDRGTPRPNSHDNLLPASVMARGTNSVNYTTQLTNLLSTNPAKNGQFTIAQVGTYTTTTALTLNNPGAGNYGVIDTVFYQQAHNLSFIPGVIGYQQAPDGSYTMLPYNNFTSPTTTEATWYNFEISVDATYIYLELIATGYGTGLTFAPGQVFKWFLLYQTSN